MRCLQQIELVLQVEVEETLNGSMCSDDAGRNCSLQSLLLQLRPMFIPAAVGGGYGEGQPLALRGGISWERPQNSIRDLVCIKWLHFLPVIGVKLNGQSNAFQVYSNTVRRVVAEDHLHCQNSCRERGFLRKFFLVLTRIGPGQRGNGKAFVRFQ